MARRSILLVVAACCIGSSSGIAANIRLPPATELHGRPEGPIAERLKRAEVVRLLRRSANRRWRLVERSTGQVAWVASGGSSGQPAPTAAEESKNAPPSVEAAHPVLPPPPEPEIESSSFAPENTVQRSFVRQRKHYFGVGVRAGFAIVASALRATSASPLPGYEFSAYGYGIAAGLGYTRASGPLRFSFDGSYALTSADGIRLAQGALSVNVHTVDAGLRFGAHFDAAGGIDLGFRFGAALMLTRLSGDPSRTPSDRVLGMTLGLDFALPSIARSRLGLYVRAGALAPAERAQTNGPDLGASTTYGFSLGGGLSVALLNRTSRRGQLSLAADYTYAAALSRYESRSVSRGSLVQFASLGLVYHY